MSEPSFFSFISWISFFSKGKSKAEGQHLLKSGRGQGQWQLGNLTRVEKVRGTHLSNQGARESLQKEFSAMSACFQERVEILITLCLLKVAHRKKLSDDSWFAKRLSSITTKTPNNKESDINIRMPRPFYTWCLKTNLPLSLEAARRVPLACSTDTLHNGEDHHCHFD